MIKILRTMSVFPKSQTHFSIFAAIWFRVHLFNFVRVRLLTSTKIPVPFKSIWRKKYNKLLINERERFSSMKRKLFLFCLLPVDQFAGSWMAYVYNYELCGLMHTCASISCQNCGEMYELYSFLKSI